MFVTENKVASRYCVGTSHQCHISIRIMRVPHGLFVQLPSRKV